MLYDLLFLQGTPELTGNEFNIWMYLLQIAPVVAVLGYFAWYNLNKDKDNEKWFKEEVSRLNGVVESKEKEMKELNEYIRENDKENLKILQDFSKLIEESIKKDKINTDKISRKIEDEISIIRRLLEVINPSSSNK
jgi:hypothetical protein